MPYAYEDIIALHKKYAPSIAVYELVFTHCTIVCEITQQLIKKSRLSVDHDLVKTGALLHDIGVYPLFNADGKLREGVNYITHGVEGEKILKAEGFPKEIWRFAAHHTGVGLTKQDIITQKLPLPAADYLAESDEELLVMYADKFHSKTTPPHLNSYEWYRKDIARFGEDKAAQFDHMATRLGVPELETLSSQYTVTIR